MKNKHALAERLRGAAIPRTLRGDHTLNNLDLPREPWRPAAVLIPLLAGADDTQIVFTLRTAHLQAHAGQVSFPGGGAEPQDADVVATALREAWEEIGLDPQSVEVLGTLDPYVTRTGFHVTPVVGMVDITQGLPRWMPDSFEVADIFTVPLTHVLDEEVLRCEDVAREGMVYKTYVCRWQEYYIWGATAGMLNNLAEVLRP